MKVLHFVNSGTSTAFSVELAAKINTDTNADVTMASFFDNSLDDVGSDVATLDIEIVPLGADSRFDLRAFWKLRRLLDGFDILHTHFNFAGSVGRLAAVGTSTEIVNTEHNDHRHFSYLQNLVNCPTYPLIDAMILNSESTRNNLPWYEQPFLDERKCVTIYNGIDFTRIDAAIDRIDIPALPEGPKIVTAARIDEQKNIETLVQAMDRVLDSVPEAELIIVGDGSSRPRAEAMAGELGIDHSTTFLGYLPEREQVYGVMEKCDIFAVPSIYEGFCNAAVEAMGCGLPVVASDIAVLREVVNEGGRFADPRDPSGFANELIYLLENESARTDLAAVARERARTTFPIERTVEAYYQVYKQVLDAR